MITIRLTLEGNVDRWAQDRSATFDNSFTVCKQSEAKQFDSVRCAHAWLAKHGFMKRVHRRHNATGFSTVKNMPTPFVAWELEGVTRETKVSL